MNENRNEDGQRRIITARELVIGLGHREYTNPIIHGSGRDIVIFALDPEGTEVIANYNPEYMPIIRELIARLNHDSPQLELELPWKYSIKINSGGNK